MREPNQDPGRESGIQVGTLHAPPVGDEVAACSPRCDGVESQCGHFSRKRFLQPDRTGCKDLKRFGIPDRLGRARGAAVFLRDLSVEGRLAMHGCLIEIVVIWRQGGLRGRLILHGDCNGR